MSSIRGLRLLVGALVVLVCAASIVGFAYGSRQKHFRLRAGDSVSVPSLGWTCVASTYHRRPILTCTSDDKPIRVVTVWLHQMTIGGTGHPVHIHGGYRFRY